MAYQELIKNFAGIRDYMREFVVYGFKSREEYTGKSGRTYDDSRRRIESWLGEHIHVQRTPVLTEKNGNSPSGQAVFFNELSVTREDNNIYSSALRFFAAIHNITAQVITHNAPPVRVDNTTVLPAVLQPPEAKISRFYQQSARACLSASAELNWMAFQLRFFAAAMSSARSST